MHRRFVDKKLQTALTEARVVLLSGARETGKSTLLQQLAAQRGGQYLSLDDPATAGLARSDPWALVQGAGVFMAIDEVQHAPGLLPAIARLADVDGRPGRFLLAGSANTFLPPGWSDSQPGHIRILPLHPLSQGELAANESNLVDALFGAMPWRAGAQALDRLGVCERLLAGGFPEVLARAPGERRNAWFRGYVANLLQRDVRDLAYIDGLSELARLLALLAARSGALLNMSEVARAAGLAHTTLRRYLALLEAIFVFQPLPAWSKDSGKRWVKSPKIHLLDSGLAAHLRGVADAPALAQSPDLAPLLETFVVQEVRKLLGWSRNAATPCHFRTAAGQEVDMVLEAADGRIAGIEVRAASGVEQRDFSGLRALAEAAGDQFAGGVLLYLGEERLPFADKLWALPITALWQAAEAAPASQPDALAYGSKFAPTGPKSTGSKPLAEKLRISQTKLAALCRKYGIARLSLFGSAARNELRPESDVNLMAEFAPEHHAPLAHIAEMQQEFSAAFGGRKVDIATPELLRNPSRRDSIVPELKLIYAA